MKPGGEMNDIQIETLTPENFHAHSLDTFIRRQVVTECWRRVQGEWKLVPHAFIEDRDLPTRRSIARAMAGNLNGTMVDFGAFHGDTLVGYITVGKERFGSKSQYVELVEFEVSEPYRSRGIGRRLFGRACEAARALGAQKLYISAHSSRESQAAYRRLGCVLAQEINPPSVAKEPFDVQMEYVL